MPRLTPAPNPTPRPHPTSAATGPDPRPGLGTVLVTARCGVGPFALARRHPEPGPVQAIADLVRDTARELDRLDTHLLRMLTDEARDLAEARDDIAAHQRPFSRPEARDRGDLLRAAVAHDTTRSHLTRLLDTYTDATAPADADAGNAAAHPPA